MRLLYSTGDGNFKFTKDIIRIDEIPPYAILSHTWGDQEVVLEDVKTSNMKEIQTEKKGGWEKIRFCARQAKPDGLEHFWVDTCCIDKTNNTELSEAINSMFRWYQNAKKCYVYLPDVECQIVHGTQKPRPGWEAAFRTSRWFSRGWTLQELIAPRSVEFFSRNGIRLGDKMSVSQIIHEVTKIPAKALSGDDISKFDVFERFSWAQNRQTMREEDGAYCLLGIVGCYLPLIYGEGKDSALKRLRTEMQGGERLSQIRNWLSAPDPYINYLKAHKQRQAGTGLWLLRNEKFKKWKEDAASRLWLHGIPGCGKTILSSAVVENLQHHCDGDKLKVTVYFYFDFNDVQKRLPEPMLRSILRQLLQHSITIPEGVDALFSSCRNGEQQPSLPALLTVAPQVMRQFAHVYIVLDALDESTKRAELMDMLETLAGWQLDNSHLLMTSRKERDIEMSLETFVAEDNMICLQRDVVDEDILRFVQQKLRDDKRLAKWHKNAQVRQEIETALMRGAQGMFRWAVCQLDMITECRNLAMLRKSLATLPQTLDQTYDRILTAINEKDRMYTSRILQWLVFSARPLSLEEVAEVVAIDFAREPAFDPEEVLMDPLEALEICSSLVTIVTKKSFRSDQRDKRIVALAHYSVQEYLVSERISQGPANHYSMEATECHKRMTIGCLGYLNQFQYPLTPSLRNDAALADYSAQSWYDHLRKTGQWEEEVSRLAMNFMSTDNPAFANSIRIYQPDYNMLEQPMIGEIATPLYYAAFWGLKTITKLLLDQGVDVNARSGSGVHSDALHAAVAEGHFAVAELLVNAKADVNARDNKDRNTLQIASHRGDEAMVRLLLDAGADVKAPGTLWFESTNRVASDWRQSELDESLLNMTGEVQTHEHKRFNALQRASANGHTAVIKLLLDAGANINGEGESSALHIAFRNAHETTAMLLLERGANVGRDSCLRGALHYLLDGEWCPPSLANVLQRRGAPINTIDVFNMTPLHYCVKWQHDAIAKQLIDAGVQTDSRVCRQTWPIRMGKSRDSGVNTTRTVPTSTAVGLTPLHFAALDGRARMAKFLLEYGADPNALSEYGETPLHFALRGKMLGRKYLDGWNKVAQGTSEGREEVLNALLEDPRTSLTTADDNGESSLHCLDYGPRAGTFWVQRLISRGADPSLVNSSQHSPLHLAAQAGHTELVKALIGMGANVSLPDKNGLNPLHYAARHRHHKTVVAILESEQARAVKLVTSKDGNGRNVLHHALITSSIQGETTTPDCTVQWLLDHGANGAVPDNFGISPLAGYIMSPTNGTDMDIIRALLKSATNRSFVDHRGQTLGHMYAKTFGFDLSMLQVFNEYGVDLTRRDRDGRTVLHCAVMCGSLTEEILDFLVNVVGLDTDEQDVHGRTALQCAIKNVEENPRFYEDTETGWERTRDILQLHATSRSRLGQVS